jgi:hypothetical protein
MLIVYFPCYAHALQTISYMAERVVGHGSFGTVFQVLLLYKSCYYKHLSSLLLSLF